MKRLILICALCLSTATLSADYVAQAALASDPTFQSRVKIAGYIAAIAISNEATNTPNHTNRMTFARVYADNADPYVAKLAFGVAADPTILAGSADSQIQTRLAAIWDTYAGKD